MRLVKFSLVITIIVMLVLAGVSLNAIVGDNGILNQAKKAKIASDKASIIELLDTELASYNIDTITGNPGEVKAMMVSLLDKGVIDSVLRSDSSYGKVTEADADDVIMGVPKVEADNSYTVDYAVKKGDYSILVSADRDGIYKSSFGEVTISAGGKVEGGTTLVTDKAFESGGVDAPAEDKGKFTIEDDATVMFTTEIGKNGEQLSIYVKSGTHAQIKVFKDMILTNQGMKRSAIDIESGGTLDLWVAEGATVTVDSGFGEDGEVGNSNGAKGGAGGYAGIHVPEGAILDLKGSGTVIAYGGNAGNGTDSADKYGGGRRWPEQELELDGKGGKGGNGSTTEDIAVFGTANDDPSTNTNCGWDGENGEKCGNISIYGNLTVYAYGGKGGSGGNGVSSSGGGGGGYPSAGIGGGGAGRSVVETIVKVQVGIQEQVVNLIRILDIMAKVEELLI